MSHTAAPSASTDFVQTEIERLDIQHRALSKVFDDRLVFPPVQRLKKVLDCGYGSGGWAMEVAEQNESCSVSLPAALILLFSVDSEAAKIIAVDISPHMGPDDTPENLWLQVPNTLPYAQIHVFVTHLAEHARINADIMNRPLFCVILSIRSRIGVDVPSLNRLTISIDRLLSALTSSTLSTLVW